MPRLKLLGLVLAGGRSSRMGRDKASLRPFQPLAATLLARTFALASAFCPETLISSSRDYAPYPCLGDSVEGTGPAAGILSGLELAKKIGFAGILALACDLPLLAPQTLRALVLAHAGAPGGTLLTVYEQPSGRLEMLAAIYDAGCLPLFNDAIKTGKLALRHIVPLDRQQRLPVAENMAPCFLNCNTPDDLAAAERFMRGGKRDK